MKLPHTSLCLLSGLSPFLLSGLSFLLLSCSGSDSRPKAHVEDENRAAVAYGRQQALRLAVTENPDSLEMEKILIDVRVRENTLRREGEDDLADSYISSFLATLDSVNPALYAEIGAGK